MKPICYDLFCGLGGWTEAFMAEGYECIGFDVEAHDYGMGGDWFGKNCETSMSRLYGSKSNKRKAASAMIAKIPFPLAAHIARTYYPQVEQRGALQREERA